MSRSQHARHLRHTRIVQVGSIKTYLDVSWKHAKPYLGTSLLDMAIENVSIRQVTSAIE